MNKPARVLTAAGAASGGSAGIQADLKTFQELDVYGMSVVTAIVGRHPVTNKNVHPQTIEAIEAQFDTAKQQIGFEALKTGMLFSKDVIETTAELIKGASIEHIVVDPVMVGKLDSKLLQGDEIEALIKYVIQQATAINPHITEASNMLEDRPLHHVADIKQPGIDLHQLRGKDGMDKEGQLKRQAVNVLCEGTTEKSLEDSRIES